MTQFDPNAVEPCHACGEPTHLHLLDAKPDDPSDPDGCNWTRLECSDCYGPGWLPVAREDDLIGSLADLATKAAIRARAAALPGDGGV